MSSVDRTENRRRSSTRLGKTDDQRIKIDTKEIDPILKIKQDFQSALRFLQVHTSNSQSPERNSISASSNNFEPSFDLTLEEIFAESNFVSTSDLPLQSFEEFLKLNPDMTFKELSNIPMEQNDYSDHQMSYGTDVSSSNVVSATSPEHDESTNSSSDSSFEDNERDIVNRRGLKKSGGPVRKLARFGNKQVIKYSDEYHERRVKNNEAVKKSRMKAKEKQKTTEEKMNKLAEENRTLNDRVDLLLKELNVLKSLYRELNQDLPVPAVKALERVNVR